MSKQDWRPLHLGNLAGLKGHWLLVVRADGKGYYGKLESLNENWLVLQNHGTSQRVLLHPNHFFTIVELPQGFRPSMAQPHFNWKDN